MTELWSTWTWGRTIITKVQVRHRRHNTHSSSKWRRRSATLLSTLHLQLHQENNNNNSGLSWSSLLLKFFCFSVSNLLLLWEEGNQWLPPPPLWWVMTSDLSPLSFLYDLSMHPHFQHTLGFVRLISPTTIRFYFTVFVSKAPSCSLETLHQLSREENF